MLDRPFTVSPEADAYISIVTFRGENIFYRNEYVDAGAFQYYGVGINNLAISLTAERQGGFLNWGQQISYNVNGTWHGGSQPNLYNQWLGIEVLEGLWPDHREADLSSGNYTGFGDPLQTAGYSFQVAAAPPSIEITQGHGALDRFIRYSRNVVHSNGGIMVQHGSDVIIENTVVKETALGYSIADPMLGGPYARSQLASFAPFVVVNTSDPAMAPTGVDSVVMRNNVWEH
jgi:hypothetical protein